MIFYFSGTGNSLHAAKQISEKLGEKVFPLSKALELDLSNEKHIGIVYPTYNFMAPKVVVRTLQKLTLPTNAYYFAIGVVGAQVGNSLWQVKQILSAKGCKLAYSNKIRVPDNSAIAFGRNPNIQSWKFTKFASRWNGILADLQQGKYELHRAWWDPAGPLLNSLFGKAIFKSIRPDTNAGKCTGCSICAQVCPVQNIKMETVGGSTKKIAVHLDRCEFCLACVHFCPVQATEFRHKPTPKANQYHHPDENWIALKNDGK